MPAQAEPPRSRSAAPQPPQDTVRALGYVRVSTEEQGASGAGLEAQRQAIRSACTNRGFELVDVFQDVASAKDLNRPELAACLAMLDAKKAEALVVSKLDRLSRSIIDFGSILQRAKKRGWGLVALDLGVDTTTATGELVANVMAAVAQWERQAIGQRTKEALAAKKAQGVKIGRPRALPDDVVERILAELHEGARVSAIARRLNDDGVRTSQGGKEWYSSTVQKVIAGEVKAKLAEYNGSNDFLLGLKAVPTLTAKQVNSALQVLSQEASGSSD